LIRNSYRTDYSRPQLQRRSLCILRAPGSNFWGAIGHRYRSIGGLASQTYRRSDTFEPLLRPTTTQSGKSLAMVVAVNESQGPLVSQPGKFNHTTGEMAARAELHSNGLAKFRNRSNSNRRLGRDSNGVIVTAVIALVAGWITFRSASLAVGKRRAARISDLRAD
jgi:hypothetical protein